MTLKSLLVAILVLPTYRDDAPGTPEKTAQLTAIAAAVAREARTADEAAFVLALGFHESAYSLRIGRGLCKPTECDRGRARGPWQVHRTAAMTDEQWAQMVGVENTAAQVREAAKRARWALKTCRGDARGAFVVLGGKSCAGSIPGIEKRVATFEAMRRKL